MPELAEKAHELQYTPAGVKIYEHWRRTNDVYYLRRNLERFMTMQPLTKEQYEMLMSGDVDGFVFPKDPSTDGQFLDDIGRRMDFASEPVLTLNRVPPPVVKMHPDHQVSLQGTGVIAKGVPAD